MKKKSAFLLPFTAITAVLLSLVNLFALDSEMVFSVLTGQTADVYVQNLRKDTHLTIKIGTEKINDYTVDNISDLNKPIETVIILDGSLDVTDQVKLNALNVLETAMGNGLPGETFSIYQITYQVNKLCENETDYLKAKQALESAQYDADIVNMEDEISAVINEVSQDNDATLKRIYILSDASGSDESKTNFQTLQEEVQKAGYPVYFLGCVGKDNTEKLINFGRLGNSGYISIDENTDVNSTAAILTAWNSGIMVEIPIPDQLADGQEKNIYISDGDDTYTASLIMPVAEKKTVEWKKVLPIVIAIGAIVLILLIVQLYLRSKKNTFELFDLSTLEKTAEHKIYLELQDRSDPQKHAGMVISGTVKVGRSHNFSDFVIDFDPGISRYQFDVCERDGKIFAVNRSNSNITKLNGMELQGEKELKDGSILRIGHTELIVKISWR